MSKEKKEQLAEEQQEHDVVTRVEELNEADGEPIYHANEGEEQDEDMY